MSQEILIKVDTKLRIPLDELHGIQGAMKLMTKDNYLRCRKEILENGVTFTLHVWKQLEQDEEGRGQVRWWIIDGHGRHAVLKSLRDDGYSVPDVPCTETLADSFEEAKRRVLSASSLYHETTQDGLYEFMTGLGLGADDIQKYNIPGIDADAFVVDYFDNTAPAAEESEDGEQPVPVSFDAYKNASVKQVVLYYAAADYEKVVRALESLREQYGVEDFSQVVWRLCHEKFPSSAS